MPYFLEEGDFFMYSSSLTMLFSLITFIAGFKSPVQLRKWVMMSTLAFIILFVWSVIYFIPIQDTTFKGEAGTKIPPDELESKMNMFVNTNYLRQVLLFFGLVTGLHALGTSYRLRGNPN